MRITGGHSRGRRFSKKLTEGVRPPLVRMRKSIFSILGEDVDGAMVLDLFAGSGTFGFEALSRGARGVLFVESGRAAVAELEAAVEELGARTRGRVLQSDVVAPGLPLRIRLPSGSSASRVGPPFDIVFSDPPFELVREPEGLERLASSVEELLASDLLNESAVVVLRLPSRTDFGLAARARDRREYGKSAVYFFRPRSAAESE